MSANSRDGDEDRNESRDANRNANHGANQNASRGDASRDDDDHHHVQTDGIRQPVLWHTEPQRPRGCTMVSGRVANGLIQRMIPTFLWSLFTISMRDELLSKVDAAAVCRQLNVMP